MLTLLKAMQACSLFAAVSAKITVLKPEGLKDQFFEGKIETINANFGYIPYGQSFVSHNSTRVQGMPICNQAYPDCVCPISKYCLTACSIARPALLQPRQ